MEQREVVHDKVHYFKSGLTTLSEKKTALGVGFAKSSLHAEQESSSWEVSQSPRSASSGLLFVGCGFVLHSRSSFPSVPWSWLRVLHQSSWVTRRSAGRSEDS